MVDAEGEDNGGGFEQNHGYVFEVPAFGGVVENPVPLKAMGRFAHEAIAIDPNSGFVYLTEDSGTRSGFYRFRPENPGTSRRGHAGDAGDQGAATVHGLHRSVRSDRQSVPVEWVSIPEPDPMIDNSGDNATGRNAVFLQGFEQGGTAFARLEGAGTTAAASSSTPPAVVTPSSVRCGSSVRVAGPEASSSCSSSRRPPTSSTHRTTSPSAPRRAGALRGR